MKSTSSSARMFQCLPVTPARPFAALLIAFLLMIAGAVFQPAFVRAEDPYAKFLQRLKDEQLFDVALDYIKFLETGKRTNAAFLKDIELERGMLEYQAASMLPISNPARGRRLGDAETALRRFLDTRKQHPRRGEARLKVGELLLQRADEARSLAKVEDLDKNPKDIPDAIRFYDEAHQLFESTIQELAGILEKIKGARTDPNDKAAVAYRQKVQQDLRQAQLLSAKSVEERGRSRAIGSKERTKDLETALKMFRDLYQKENRMVGVRNYALFYRSNIEEALGKTSDAIDGYRRVADLEGVDVLRPLQTTAITKLIGLLGKAKKFQPASDRAKRWLSNLQPTERESKETIDLKLALARLQIAWADSLKKKDTNDRVASRLVRNTRDELRSLSRIQGSHLQETQELLAELGVETSTDDDLDELPSVSSFAEAVAEAQKRIDRSESDALSIAILRDQGQDEEANRVESNIVSTRRQAIQLLRTGLGLFGSEDEMEGLQAARFSLAYLYLKSNTPWEALVVAELIARENPNTDQGLKASAIALGAFSDLLKTAGEEEKSALTIHLEPFAKYLVETWPSSGEASAAASALVQLALIGKQWDKVDQYLALAPTEGESTKRLRRDAGISFYNRYLDEKKKSGAESPTTNELRQRAKDSLTIATNGLRSDDIEDADLNAINALVRIEIAENQLGQAAKRLSTGKSSPLKVLEAKPDAFDGKTAMNCYRTAIQLTISQLANDTLDSQTAVIKTGQYINQLQKLAEKTAAGTQTLSGIFVALAKDLKSQLNNAKSPAQRSKLSQAMVLLAEQAGNAESFNTRFWAADTLISIAEENKSDRQSQSTSTKAYQGARDILEAIQLEEQSNPGYINPDGHKIQVQLLLAKAYRGSKEFKQALDALNAILESNAGLLTVQMEAAATYHSWGDSVSTKKLRAAAYKVAFAGHPKRKSMWGWGKIAQVLEGKTEFESQFYEARFELARSRYKMAQSESTEERKLAELRRAKNAISQTAALYPTLGGSLMKSKNNVLLKAIQKELGEPTDGLAGLDL
ncbi:MAG: hypothetical protein ACE361_23000 [Aureliella sp.]